MLRLVYPCGVIGGPQELPAGTVVGSDFRILSHMAAGGMGAVYLAEQISTGQKRALKIMHPALVEDPGMRDRFVQEARVGSMIASDHVVQVVAAGVDPQSGAPWIAMEFLEGQDLAAFVGTRGPLALGELAMVLRPICHALGAAHAAGIIHRDIKPENVFLAATRSMDPFTSVKVLDFGIAKVAAQARATATASMGTPLWMAPEQTDPRARITPAVDVWAIGLLAFWMLTGRHYWRSANAQGTSVHALMREILFEPMDFASARAVEYGMTGRIPPEFDAWFAHATAREPEQRIADARSAYEELVQTTPALQALPSVPPPTMLSAPPHPSAPSQPVQAALPSPTGTTLQAATTTPAARSGGSSLGLWVGAAGVVLALVAVVIAGVAVYFSAMREPQVATSPKPPVAPPSVSPLPVADTAPVDSSEPVASASGAPKPKTVPVPAKPKDPPFDMGAASVAANKAASSAQFMCKNREGPTGFAAKLNFNNSGTVQRVDMSDIQASGTSRGVCVRMALNMARIKAFSGPSQPVPVSVAISRERRVLEVSERAKSIETQMVDVEERPHGRVPWYFEGTER